MRWSLCPEEMHILAHGTSEETLREDASQVVLVVKNSPANAGDTCSKVKTTFIRI